MRPRERFIAPPFVVMLRLSTTVLWALSQALQRVLTTPNKHYSKPPYCREDPAVLRNCTAAADQCTRCLRHSRIFSRCACERLGLALCGAVGWHGVRAGWGESCFLHTHTDSTQIGELISVAQFTVCSSRCSNLERARGSVTGLQLVACGLGHKWQSTLHRSLKTLTG